MMTRVLIILVILVSYVNEQLSAQELKNLNLIALEELNSSVDDSSPFIDRSNNQLFFSSVNSSGDKDIFKAEWNGQKWIKTSEKITLNNRFDNEVFHIDSSGLVYFQKAILDEAGRAIFGIFTSSYLNGQWSKPQKQQIKYFNNKSNDQSFCLNQKSDVMLFSMQSYFSYGVEDLYVSFRQDENSWSEPKNLGSTINTPFEEFTPYLAEDERTLFFSSNGHPGGFGSKDIWVSYRLDNTWLNWTKPMNLGKTVNTVGMEMSFKKTGIPGIPYLVVTSRTSAGQSDIFGLKVDQRKLDSMINLIIPDDIEEASSRNKDSIAKPNTLNSSVLIDSEISADSTGKTKILDSTNNILVIRTFNKSTNLSIPSNIIYNSRNKQDSLYLKKDSLVKLQFSWLDTVEITVKSNSFLPQTKTIIFENKHFGIELNENIYLDSIEIGKSIKFEHVLFKRGTPDLLESSNSDLDNVAQVLNENKDLSIQIAGHTDNSGNAYLNFILSEKRANTIKKYLIEKGIKAERIETKGFGGSKPIASNESEETMKLNRRVEFKLMKKE